MHLNVENPWFPLRVRMTDYQMLKYCLVYTRTLAIVNWTMLKTHLYPANSPVWVVCAGIDPSQPFLKRKGLASWHPTLLKPQAVLVDPRKREEETFPPKPLPHLNHSLHSGAELLARHQRNDTPLITAAALTTSAFPMAPSTWLLFSLLPIRLD